MNPTWTVSQNPQGHRAGRKAMSQTLVAIPQTMALRRYPGSEGAASGRFETDHALRLLALSGRSPRLPVAHRGGYRGLGGVARGVVLALGLRVGRRGGKFPVRVGVGAA